jgi:hypothetical protein
VPLQHHQSEQQSVIICQIFSEFLSYHLAMSGLSSIGLTRVAERSDTRIAVIDGNIDRIDVLESDKTSALKTYLIQGYAIESVDERQCRNLLVLRALGLPVYVECNPGVETSRVRLERLAAGRSNSALQGHNETSYLWHKLVDSARCLYISANQCLDNQNGILMARSDIRAPFDTSASYVPQETPRDNETTGSLHSCTFRLRSRVRFCCDRLLPLLVRIDAP